MNPAVIAQGIQAGTQLFTLGFDIYNSVQNNKRADELLRLQKQQAKFGQDLLLHNMIQQNRINRFKIASMLSGRANRLSTASEIDGLKSDFKVVAPQDLHNMKSPLLNNNDFNQYL